MKHYKYLDETLGYVYFRLNGKRIALPGEKGSAEFDAAYDKLFAQAQRTKAARKMPSRQRTMAALPASNGSSRNFFCRNSLSVSTAGRRCSLPARKRIIGRCW